MTGWMTDTELDALIARTLDDPADDVVLVPLIRYGPGVASWADDVFAWCQRCDRGIRTGQPYMPRIPMVCSRSGFDHQWCPPVLTVVR